MTTSPYRVLIAKRFSSFAAFARSASFCAGSVRGPAWCSSKIVAA
jgi:hypothetical protein